uniref:Phospholipid transfer protein n=1 Tax=Astyanax mexicanus TaxID=7994 RepID=A0A8B9KI15_ASTMX
MGVYGAAIIFLLLPLVAKMSEIPPGCKIRITSKGLEMLKHETQKFVEEELGNITMPEMHGKEGRFQYSITNVKITELNLTAALGFQPTSGLLFEVHNSSITVNFQRRILYWFFIDEGPINASAEGVNIHTALELAKDELGRLKIANASCDASIAKMRAKFAACLCFCVVRAEVDSYVGIDYSLLSDPVVTGSSLDMDFRGMFYNLHNLNDTLTNYAGNPVVREYDRMIYLALSEYFFDSALYSYFKGGVFTMHIANDRMPKDLEMLLRTTYFGAIMMLVSPFAICFCFFVRYSDTILRYTDQIITVLFLIVLSHFGGYNIVIGILLSVARFKIFSNQSALESLALIPLQAPLKTMLQITVVPLINNYTKRGVRIPLPDGIDFIEEVVEYHNGYIIVGANLHFTSGLRELIAKKMSGESEAEEQ